MNTFIRSVALAFVLAAGTAAQAATFNFSYTFDDGNKVTGSFDGTANGNLVTDLSHIFVSLNGNAFPGSGSLGAYSFDTATSNWEEHAVVSFDGLHSNFGFSDGHPSTSGEIFLLIPYDTSSTEFAQLLHGGSESSDFGIPTVAAHWQLTAVPEPETYAMLLAGLGLVGFAARRRKQA
jgi:hypothetical protein